MFNNSEIHGLAFDFDLYQLHKRFEQGELGIAFPKFMRDKKTYEIYENYIVSPLDEMVNRIHDPETLEFAEAILENNTLWLNFQVNIMISLFKSAMVIWLDGKENLDKIIISLMTPKFLIELSEVMREMYSNILGGNENLVEIEQHFPPFQMESGENLDFDEDETFKIDRIQDYFSNQKSLRDDFPNDEDY